MNPQTNSLSVPRLAPPPGLARGLRTRHLIEFSGRFGRTPS
jgi:hypothetical protein